MGSTMFEENVVSAAGTTYAMNAESIERSIRQLGFEPRRRNVYYEEITA
jgi:cyclic dehypoxanthinyl futalosine synthase